MSAKNEPRLTALPDPQPPPPGEPPDPLPPEPDPSAVPDRVTDRRQVG